MWGIRLRKAGRREVPQEQVEMLIEQVMFEHTCWALHNMWAVVFVCLCMVYRSQLDEIRVIVNTKFWFLFFMTKRPTKLESWKWHEAGCTPSCWRFPGLYEWLESWRESTLPVAVKVDPSIFRLNQANIWLSLHLLPDRISHLSALEDFRTDLPEIFRTFSAIFWHFFRIPGNMVIFEPMLSKPLKV